MKFTVIIDESCEQASHQSTYGDAFSLDSKRKFAVFGGKSESSLVNLNDITNVIKKYEIKSPPKWCVSNYEWDPLSVDGNERFLQTRNKLIEIVNSQKGYVTNLDGHGRSVNDAKWSPFKRNILAASSADSNLLIWNTETPKPAIIIPSIGESDCLAWNKQKENVLAASCSNDIRIYDIRKTNSALRYISNAHTKKIYSLDWCANEEILLSSSRDRNIKLWNFNMLNQKFMEKILEDFPCWKAKFTQYGLCFAVIPTCLSPPKVSQFINQSMSPTSTYSKYPFTDINTLNRKANLRKINSEDLNSSLMKGDQSYSVENGSANHSRNACDTFESNKSQNLNNKSDPITSLMICQIMSFDEAKIYKFTSNTSDMILNYDFYAQDDKFEIYSWTQNQNLCKQSIELSHIIPKDAEKSTIQNTTRFEEDIGALKSNTSVNITSNLQIQPNTGNSSRKSSISEYGYGTPPSNLTSNFSIRMMSERESINLNEIVGHEFLKKNPKCFGAKFSGLPEQFIIFTNESMPSNSKSNNRDSEQLQFTKRIRGHTKSKIGSKSYHKHLAKRTQSKVYVYNISIFLNMSREFAEEYEISEMNLESICDQNIAIAASMKRYDIIRIWELIKFVTKFNNNEKLSLDPNHGRPWSCSAFGRPLVTNIIYNCVKSSDVQTAAMIISKLKQYDMNMVADKMTVNRRKSKLFEESIKTDFIVNEKNQTRKNGNAIELNRLGKLAGDSDLIQHQKNLGLLDPQHLSEFDTIIRFYCEILYQWNLLNKRTEMLEYIHEKPNNYDEKFECSKICFKCSGPTTKSKCVKCNTYVLNCSICYMPVNGLSNYCVICGHGGHYDHLIEWFKRHDDCPSACGCRCIDYL